MTVPDKHSTSSTPLPAHSNQGESQHLSDTPARKTPVSQPQLLQPRSRNFNPAKLFASERYWRDHQPWLELKGYMLRPRYHPDWAPTFTVDDFWKYEDGFGRGVGSFSLHYLR